MHFGTSDGNVRIERKWRFKPCFDIPDGSIRIEQREEHVPFRSSSGFLNIDKSIIHITVLRYLSDDPNSDDIRKIYLEVFKILISFLQLYRMKTKNFIVKPAEICGPWTEDINESKASGFPLITYNPHELEKIEISYEPKHEGASIALLNRNFFAEEVIYHPSHGRPCKEFEWQEICQELNILLQNSSSYSIPDEKLLADELLTKANEFMSVFYDSIPLPNDPLYQFRYPGPGICAAIINIAVACEIYVKGYVRRKGNPIYEKILENHRDFTVPVKDYLDYIIKDITGFSLKEQCNDLWKNIELLFELRNKIVHSGKLIYKPNNKEYTIYPIVVHQLGICVEKVIKWLESLDKDNFDFNDIPKLREEITSRD
jgi:hypothetical protein